MRKKVGYVDYEESGGLVDYGTGTTISLDVDDENDESTQIIGFSIWIWKFNIDFSITKE